MLSGMEQFPSELAAIVRLWISFDGLRVKANPARSL